MRAIIRGLPEIILIIIVMYGSTFMVRSLRLVEKFEIYKWHLKEQEFQESMRRVVE